MAKSRKRSRSRRKNPIGTLLVNPGKRGGKSRKAKSRKAVSLASLLSRATRSNPGKRRHSRRSSRKNPIVFNPRKRASKRYGRKRNGTYAVMNPRRHGRKSRRHGRRRNPILMNPILVNRRKGKHSKRRHNPGFAGMPGKLLGSAQGMVRKVPLLGGLLSAAVGALGGAIGGGAGAFGLHFAMGHLGRFIPDWLKPYGYTVAGALLSGGVKLLPVNLPYKNQLAIGLAAAGGAVDVYRMRIGKSMELAGDDDYGDYGDLGDDELGNDGSPLASVEFADASLMDAEYAGDDLSDEELAAAELGRAAFRKRFVPRKRKASEGGDEPGASSEHAGKPGRRWGWLIYWIGHDNMQVLAQKPENERKAIIAHLKHEAFLRARKLLQQGIDPNVQQAETAGLLVAA